MNEIKHLEKEWDFHIGFLFKGIGLGIDSILMFDDLYFAFQLHLLFFHIEMSYG